MNLKFIKSDVAPTATEGTIWFDSKNKKILLKTASAFEEFGFGYNPKYIPKGTDYNTIKEPGIYYGDGETANNCPYDNGFMLVVHVINKSVYQTAYSKYAPWRFKKRVWIYQSDTQWWTNWDDAHFVGKNFAGCTAKNYGDHGMVPQPIPGQQDYYLKGSGGWAPIADCNWLEYD